MTAGFCHTPCEGRQGQTVFHGFYARVVRNDGSMANLMIEITDSTDKAEKWYVENRWIPAVNAEGQVRIR